MQNQEVISPQEAMSQTNPPLENLTGKIKIDEKGMRYIDNPDMPNGREYLLNTNVTSFDLYERYADTHSESDEWLSGSPVQFYAPEGYDAKMDLQTLKNPELREDYFAKQQSILGLLGKSAVRGLTSLTVGTLEGLGYLINPNTYRALFGDEVVGEFENEFSRIFREIKESINDTAPIYRTIKSKSNDLWEAMFDATFWAGNAESIATTLSLMIPGMGMAKGISLLAKAAKLSKDFGRVGAGLGSGLFSRVMESGMEAKEAFDSFIEGHKYDDRYINDETQLRLDAGKAASFTMQRNMPLFLIDAFQLDNIATGLLTFRNANNLTKKLINKAVDYGVVGLSEGAEEGTQFVIQKEGEYRSLSDPNVKKLMGETFGERWDKYTDDIEFQTSVLLGAVGGGLFKGTGSAARHIYNKALERIKAYKEGKTVAATNEDKKIFEILSDKEFEDQLMQHVKADSVDELLSLYEDQVKNLEGEEKSKVEDLISIIKAVQTSLPELKQFPGFKENPKDALLFALVQNDQVKQNTLNKALNNQLEAEISSMNIEGQDTKDVALNLKLGAYKRVMDNLDSLKRINEVEKGKIKEAYKQHIDNLKSQIQGKVNYQDIVSKNPALEEIAYKEEQNVVETLISNKIIEKLNAIKNNKTTTEETKTETKSEAKKEETKPKKEDIEQPEGDVFEEEITPEGPEQQIRIPEQKQEEQKKTPANKEPEQDTKQDEADKKASDESAPEKDIEETKIQKDDGEFDIEEEISTGLGRQDKEAPIIAESDQQIQASQIEGLADNIFNDISNIDNFPSYYTAREQAKQASTKNKLSEEVFDKLYKNEDKLLKDMDLDNPSSAQANALAARFSDLVRDGALGAVLKDALINKVPIDESILGDFIGAYNAMLKAVKGLQSSKQYGNVTPAPQIPDNVPIEEDNSQQADDVETEYNQTDPLRIVSFKYSYEVYTDSKGQKRVKTIPQTKQDSIKYNSYINFEETIKPEVAKVGSKIFFGIPEEFLQYQHNASDADILIYDENGNGISWLRRESTAKKWGASSEELNTLNKQRALLYSKATSYQGESILINGKRVIPCNVSSNITSKSYGVITHDGDNYYPIKEALQTDNLDNIVLGVVIGNEAGGYNFHIPSVSLEDKHVPPADKFRTGHVYAMVQSANGDYFPLRLYTQKYSTLQKGTKLYNYYRDHMNEAFKKILSSDAKTSEQGSYELAKYVVLRLVKNNDSARPFKVQTYKDHKYEDTGETLTREEAIERVKNSLINIPYNLLNSKSPVMTELLNSDALQMNIFPGEPFHSPTFGFDQNLIDLKETKPIIEEVKEPTKETKIEEPIVKEEVTDPVEKSFEQNTTPEAVKELPSELPKKRGPLANLRSKLSMALKGKNFVKPDLSRRAEWGKDMGKYSLSNLTKEEAEILEKAPRDSNGNLLAPNGKPSNLTIKQYAQVRTKAFKNWFGDWERAANNSLGDLKGNTDISEIINVDGTINFDKLEEITNKYFKNVDSSLFKKGRKTLRERQEKHFDINGNPIEANTLEHLINVTKSASEIDIKEELKPILILAAALHDIAKPFHGGQRHGFQSVDVINSIFKGNISPLVKFAVRHHMFTLEESKEFTIDDAKRIIQDAIDNNINVQDAIDILLALNTSDIMMGQKLSDIDRYSGKTKKETIEKEIPTKRKLLELATKNLLNDVSKVVDENGEPLVVYHGSQEKFEEFSKEKRGKYTGAESAKLAFFAASSELNSANYAKLEDIISAFEDLKLARKADVNLTAEDIGAVNIPSKLDELQDRYVDSVLDIQKSYSSLASGYAKYLNSKGRSKVYKQALTISKEDEWVTGKDLNDYKAEGYNITQEQQESYNNEEPIEITKSVAKPFEASEVYQMFSEENSFTKEHKDEIDSYHKALEDNEKKYSKQHENLSEESSYILQLFLNIRNPRIDDDKNLGYRQKSYVNRITDAIKEGKDGGVIKNTKDPFNTDVYYFFEPNQAKSATSNIGTFSTESGNIKYSLVDNKSKKLWNQDKEMSWLKKNLPQLTDNELVKIHKGLINVGSLYAWGRFRDGVITLSDIAAEGTAYHEAFHAVFNMYLTESEADNILRRARKEFNLEGKSDLAVEEFLADKFRDYVETDQIENRSILEKISDFFKNIYYLIREKLHLNPTIEQVFYNTNRGRYAKKKFEKNRPLVERNWLSNIIPSVYKRRVDMLVDIFEDMIDNLANEYPELSRADVIKQYSLSDWILEIHDQLYASAHGEDAIYTNPEQIDAIDLITDELVEFDADLNPKFGQLALDMLKEISGLEGITFRATQIVDMDMNKQDETEEFMNNEETNKQEGWQIDQMLVSPVTKLRQSTRNIIRRIPKADASGNLLAPDDLGYTVYMSGTEVFATMLNKLSSMNKPSDLMKRLESLKTNFPWVGSIIDILKANPQVKVDFYNSFRNDSVEYMIINTQSDGTARVFAGNTLNTTDEVLKVWSTNYSMLEHNKEGYVDSLIEMAAKIRKIYEPIPQDRFRKFIAKQWLSNWKSGTFSNPQVNGWAKTASEAMKLMGMDATPTELVKIFQSNLRLNDPRSNFEPAHDFLLKLYGSLNMFALTLKKPEFNVNGDVYSEIEKTSFYAKIKALAKAVADVRPSLHESSLREGGKTYSSNITPSFIQKLFKRLTDVTDRSAYDVFKKSFFYTNNKGEITHPWLSSLLDARTKDRADEIRVGIFLQKDKVKYSELSKPDFLASKINLWANNNNRNYGYYMMPIPSDASSMPVIRFRKYEMRETVSGLTELAKAEIRRIDVYNERKKLIKEGKILGIKNFDATFKKGKVVEGRGAKFLMFPFLNQYSLEELKNSEEKLTQYIIEAVDKGFEAFKANPDLDLNKVDKRMRLDQNLKEFYYNDLMAQYSIMTMTSGDLAYYKNDVDFFKRNKQNMSPGQYGDWESLGIPEKFKAIRMRDNEMPSLVADAYYENLVKNGVSHTEAMIIAAKFGYSNAVDENGKRVVKLPNGKIVESGLNNSTDGQTFITLDRYRNVARMNSKWDDAKEKSYQNLKSGNYTKEDILTFSLQPIKPYMFSPHNVDSGVEIDGKQTALYQPLQNKNSEAVLIPQMVQNSPLLSALIKGMEQNGIEAVYFESAVKEGIEVNTPKEIKDKLRAQGKEVLPDAVLEFTGDPNELSEANLKHYYLSNDDYMYQMDTPEHFKDTLQLFGSQIRKHIIANLDSKAEFVVWGKKYNGEQLALLYDKIISLIYDANYEKVEKKIGTIEGLAEQLQSSVMQRKLAENTTEAIQLMNYKGKKVFKLPLYFPLQSNRMFQMISSIFRNNIIRYKVSGGAFYQATSFGYDDTLKVHMKDGHLEYVDCIVPYTYSKQLLELADENGMIDPDKVEDKELLKMICYRIPTEDKYSAVPLRIKGFSSPAEGGIIKLPSDILTITGSDLDKTMSN